MNKVFVALAVLAICVGAILAKPHGRRGGHGGKGRKGGKGPGGFLLKFACQVYNSSDPTAEPQTKQCGCAEPAVGETAIACEVRTQGSGIPLTDKFGNNLDASFCPLEEPQWATPHPFRNVGIVSRACLIEIDVATSPDPEILHEKNCSRDAQCVTDVAKAYDFKVNVTIQARAYFCDNQLEQQERPGRSRPVDDVEEDDVEEEEDDVGLERLVNANDEPCVPLHSERPSQGPSGRGKGKSQGQGGRPKGQDDEGQSGQRQGGQQQGGQRQGGQRQDDEGQGGQRQGGQQQGGQRQGGQRQGGQQQGGQRQGGAPEGRGEQGKGGRRSGR